MSAPSRTLSPTSSLSSSARTWASASARRSVLSRPPYAFAAIVVYATGWAGDKYRIRGPVVIFNALLCLIGLPIMGFHSNPAVRYLGVFFVTAGASANVPASMAYQANNIRGQWKRAFSSATYVSFGGIGGIMGTLVFRSEDAPGYKPGLYTCIACAGATILIVLALMAECYRLNKKADRGEVELECDEVSSGCRLRVECKTWTQANVVAGHLRAWFPLYLLGRCQGGLA